MKLGMSSRPSSGLSSAGGSVVSRSKTGAADQALAQRRHQVRLVHQAAAGGVDQQRPLLHRPELRHGDHVAGFKHERGMQGDDVARLQHLVPRRVEGAEPAAALVRREHDAHAQCPGDIGHRLTQHALADDAQTAAAQILDGIIEEAELPALLPSAAAHRPSRAADRRTTRRHSPSPLYASRCISVF